MNRALLSLLLLSMTSACPSESGPAAGDLEPLPVPTGAPAAAPPPKAPPPAAPARAVAPPAPVVETCCVFSDGNRMKGLTLEECKASAGTFDPECKKKIEPAAAPKAAEEEPGAGNAGSCCIFPGGMTKNDVPRAMCEAGKGEYSLDCED